MGWLGLQIELAASELLDIDLKTYCQHSWMRKILQVLACMVSGMMISCKLQYLCHPFIIFDLWTLEFYFLAISWVSHIWGKFLPFGLERLLGSRAERGGWCLLCACIACISTSDKKEIGESWKGRACGFNWKSKLL